MESGKYLVLRMSLPSRIRQNREEMKIMCGFTVLAIESSCDETAAAVVVNGRDVLSNIIASQIDIHKIYGGVVPEIASDVR